MSTRRMLPDGRIDPRSVAPTWGPPRGYLRQVAECLRSRGWDTTYDPSDDSLAGVVPPDRRQAFADDLRECEHAAGMPEGQPPPFTDDQLTVLYQHELWTVAGLRRLGHEIPEPPSEAVFKAGYESGTVRSAYASLPHMPEAEWRRVNEECPQSPDGW